MSTNAINVAKYFLSKTLESDENITNLKLQKLLYYAQGYHLALYDSELFHEEICAWTHGPVCPEIYYRFKEFGSNNISYNEKENFSDIFTPEQLDFLDEVYNVFGQFSAWKLRDMTHEESPWINNKSYNGIIPPDEMRDYFNTRVG
jgi:uncharacterized phage-associated protein